MVTAPNVILHSALFWLLFWVWYQIWCHILVWLPVPNMMPHFGLVTRTKYDATFWSGYPYQIMCLIYLHITKWSTITWPWLFRVESCSCLHHVYLRPNPVSGCVTDFQGWILVMVPNVFLDSSFSNLVCAHTVFERSTDKEWLNSFQNLFRQSGWSPLPVWPNSLNTNFWLTD